MILGISNIFHKGAREFPEPAYDEQVVRASLKTIILTTVGERVMRPTFGSRAIHRIFENPTPGQLAAIKYEIQTKIAIWEPRVRILRVSVVPEESAKGTSTVATIDYLFVGAPTTTGPSTLSVPVGR